MSKRQGQKEKPGLPPDDSRDVKVRWATCVPWIAAQTLSGGFFWLWNYLPLLVGGCVCLPRTAVTDSHKRGGGQWNNRNWFSPTSRSWKPEIKVSADPALSEGFQEKPLVLPLPSFWWLRATLGTPWLVDLSFQSVLVSMWPLECLCPRPDSLLLVRTPVIVLGSPPIQYGLILTWWHLQGSCIPIRPPAQVLEVRALA